ncbi:hypothetical protein NU688_13970 [Variovorax sp. ZS18.2.2]|uniref:hypothetical protein n=1 Tax=Variovorax sp. ZS18.2.2 TaxID=2971255 RepID=UPI002151CD0B|nr:hypothetical protein [Variovorax sp. ZS18.2.2]MCR6477263.1 hypothetical protein [Variovorax sp. ZS18.2.2]
MGFAISWLAVKADRRQEALAHCGLRATGVREELPESDFCGVDLPSGWFLVFINSADSALHSDASLRKLSLRGEVFACEIEEHVMVSAVSCWRNGSLAWSAVHDAERGLLDLEETGTLPEELPSIRARALAQHEADADGEVDYMFEVPVELAQAAVGFRYDQDIKGAGDEPFEVLSASGKGG